MKIESFFLILILFFGGGISYSKDIVLTNNFDWNISHEKRTSKQFILSEDNTVIIKGLIDPASFGLKDHREIYVNSGHLIVDGISIPIQLLTNYAFTKYKQNSHISKLTEEANEFGRPYSEFIGVITKKELLTDTIKLVSEIENSQIIVMDQENLTVGNVKLFFEFFITRDHQAIVLDTVFQEKNANDKNATDLNIKIVTNPQSAFSSINDWKNDNYNLKQEFINLLAESIRIFLFNEFIEEISKSPKEKTVRYLEGKTLRFERGLVYSEYCGRTLMRNLRGIIFSVPSIKSFSDVESKCLDRHESTFKLH